MSEEFYIPTREEVEAIEVGSTVTDCFGRPAEVLEIGQRCTDELGRVFVIARITWGRIDGGTMTSLDCFKEGVRRHPLPAVEVK